LCHKFSFSTSMIFRIQTEKTLLF